MEEELVAIDLQTPGWPTIPAPYLAPLHSSAITCSCHVSNVPLKLWERIISAGEQQSPRLSSAVSGRAGGNLGSPSPPGWAGRGVTLAPALHGWARSLPPSLPPGLAHRWGEEPGPGAHAEGASPHRVSGLAVGRGAWETQNVLEGGGTRIPNSFLQSGSGMGWWWGSHHSYWVVCPSSSLA